MKKLLAAALIASTFGAAALPAAAHTNVDFFVNAGPPPVLYAPAAPRVGFIWVPGYWDSRHGRHYWVRGHYTRYRPGYVYAPARWYRR